MNWRGIWPWPGCILCFFLFFLPGCAAPFVQEEAVFRYGGVGEVRLLDQTAIRRLLLQQQSVRRDSGGRMVVRTEWRNRTGVPYRAGLRRIFWKEGGGKEDGDPRWDVHVFAPDSVTVIEWKSYTAQASNYLIELRTAPR